MLYYRWTTDYFSRSGGMADALGLGPSGETRESSTLSSDIIFVYRIPDILTDPSLKLKTALKAVFN